jgi:rhodanese-related sulfurtransferase
LIPRLVIAACLTLGLFAWLAWPRLTWPVVKARIAKEFPSVKTVSTAELAKELDTHERQVLLDVRTAAEFDVSHLSGAQHIDPDASASELKLAKDAPIVTYCSVGYRSARFAERLRSGISFRRNLEGSIFNGPTKAAAGQLARPSGNDASLRSQMGAAPR